MNPKFELKKYGTLSQQFYMFRSCSRFAFAGHAAFILVSNSANQPATKPPSQPPFLLDTPRLFSWRPWIVGEMLPKRQKSLVFAYFHVSSHCKREITVGRTKIHNTHVSALLPNQLQILISIGVACSTFLPKVGTFPLRSCACNTFLQLVPQRHECASPGFSFMARYTQALSDYRFASAGVGGLPL
jgi:hypothetical protein